MHATVTNEEIPTSLDSSPFIKEQIEALREPFSQNLLIQLSVFNSGTDMLDQTGKFFTNTHNQ